MSPPNSHQILYLASSQGSMDDINCSSSSGMDLHYYYVTCGINCEPDHNKHTLYEKGREREKKGESLLLKHINMCVIEHGR